MDGRAVCNMALSDQTLLKNAGVLSMLFEDEVVQTSLESNHNSDEYVL